MKHGEVGSKMIALSRVMGLPESIEPGEIARRDLRGDDQRAGH